MDLTKSQCRHLIAKYKEQQCLWDKHHPHYSSKADRMEAWRHIYREMKLSMPLGALQKKMTTLMGGYRREKSREKRSVVYKSKWFAYRDFDFMPGMQDFKTSINIGQQTNRNNAELTGNADGDTYLTINPTNVSQQYKRCVSVTHKRCASQKKSPEKRSQIVKTSKNILLDSKSTVSQNDETKNRIRVAENEFDIYGMYVASQLQLLSEEQSIRARDKIQSILTECRLVDLRESRKIPEMQNIVIYGEQNDGGKNKCLTLSHFTADESDCETTEMQQLVDCSKIKNENDMSDGESINDEGIDDSV